MREVAKLIRWQLHWPVSTLYEIDDLGPLPRTVNQTREMFCWYSASINLIMEYGRTLESACLMGLLQCMKETNMIMGGRIASQMHGRLKSASLQLATLKRCWILLKIIRFPHIVVGASLTGERRQPWQESERGREAWKMLIKLKAEPQICLTKQLWTILNNQSSNHTMKIRTHE